MDELVSRHSAIMDQYDPARRIGMIVDEWGTWYDPEAGTLPGFNFQQNSLADALVAGLTLNIFNNHNERVRMANLAQMVNVLQSVILTDGPRMLRTPTYHVFDMYQVHMDAQRVDLAYDPGQYTMDGKSIAQFSASASQKDDKLSISVCNMSHCEDAKLEIEIRGFAPDAQVCGRILTSDKLDEHNTFDEPDRFVPVAMDGVRYANGVLTAVLPKSSVAVLTLG
jgi:alpha-N-arabinofuranosidase